ncbi:hypothetical protein ACFYOT_12980 [Saccharothrix saharensis]|uniref:hypothetical protein n=1 Tax=Saccharothrix saharensis TaxID=571190 RepID=UPI0036AAC5BC
MQKFQVGEAGDGANLIAKADGEGDYSRAVRLFVAEEQNHARLLALLLSSAGATTIAGHWSAPVRAAVTGTWWVLLCGAVVAVAWDHGPASRHPGVTRRGFVVDVAVLFRTALSGLQDRRNSLLPNHTIGS